MSNVQPVQISLYIPADPNYIIQPGEMDCLSIYRMIKHSMWLCYHKLPYNR